jgi:hypothetical protein
MREEKTLAVASARKGKDRQRGEGITSSADLYLGVLNYQKIGK